MSAVGFAAQVLSNLVLIFASLAPGRGLLRPAARANRVPQLVGLGALLQVLYLPSVARTSQLGHPGGRELAVALACGLARPARKRSTGRRHSSRRPRWPAW